MTKSQKKQELLMAIFEGPTRPLSKEDQEAQDQADTRHEAAVQAKNQEWGFLLGISPDEIAELRETNLMGLIERVALKKMRNPDRARQLRALLGPR